MSLHEIMSKNPKGYLEVSLPKEYIYVFLIVFKQKAHG